MANEDVLALITFELWQTQENTHNLWGGYVEF